MWAARLAAGSCAAGCGAALLFPEDTQLVYASALDHVGLPLMRQVTDAETAHSIAIAAASARLTPRLAAIATAPGPAGAEDAARLRVRLWGREFASPIGLAAGFDKNAEAMDGLFDLGFAFVEIGSVTPRPQPGNARPRVFRLEADRALINRYGARSRALTRARRARPPPLARAPSLLTRFPRLGRVRSPARPPRPRALSQASTPTAPRPCARASRRGARRHRPRARREALSA